MPPLVVQHWTDPPDWVHSAGVVGGGDPLGRAVAARAMERTATMDVNCILVDCLEDESLEIFERSGRLFGSC